MANFTQNQLVWAKVKGYPWWPAIVVSRDSANASGSVLVNFIKDNSHATLSENKVVDFNENFNQFCNGKNRKLQAAIKAAQRIEKGQSTYEDESMEGEEEEQIKISVILESILSFNLLKIRRDRKVTIERTVKEKPSRESSMEIETGKDSSTVEEKQENVENNNVPVFENLLDFVPYRVTRAQCKNQHVEVRTEPLIYQSRRRNSKKNFDTSGTKSKKPTPETPQTKQRDYMETDTDCTHQAKSSNNASPVNPVKSEDVLTNEEETAKTAIPKSNSSRKLFITTTSKVDENAETAMDPKMIFTPEKSIEKQEIEEMDYQHRKTPEIQGFENGFEQLLKTLLGKFKNGQKARKNDPNIVKLVSFLQNFETTSMNGSEIAKSEVGKLLKTIQLLFSKYKHLASDTADKILLLVNKLIKKVQDQVLEFCMDNTKYMKALNLSEPTLDDDDNNNNHTPKFDKSKISIEAPSSSLTIRIEEDITPTNTHRFFSHGLTPNMRSLYSPCVESENRVSFRKDSSDFYTNRLENSHHQHADNILLRKKICQRFTRLLHEIYKLEKEKSQEITLKIEGKIHGHCGNFIENYKHNVQNFYNLLKQQHLTLDEVLSIKQMEMNEFNEFLNKRVFKVFDNNDSLLRDRAYSYAFSISTDALESPSNQGFGFDINPMDRFPHEHMTKSDHSPTYGSFRIPPKHNLTPKENHHHHHIGFTN